MSFSSGMQCWNTARVHRRRCAAPVTGHHSEARVLWCMYLNEMTGPTVSNTSCSCSSLAVYGMFPTNTTLLPPPPVAMAHRARAWFTQLAARDPKNGPILEPFRSLKFQHKRSASVSSHGNWLSSTFWTAGDCVFPFAETEQALELAPQARCRVTGEMDARGRRKTGMR